MALIKTSIASVSPLSLLVNNNWGPKAYHKYQRHIQDFRVTQEEAKTKQG